MLTKTTSEIPFNFASGKAYTGKAAETLLALHPDDPRYITQAQADRVGGVYENEELADKGWITNRFSKQNSGVPRPSGVRRSELGNAVAYTIYIKGRDKATGKPVSFPRTFLLYHISQCVIPEVVQGRILTEPTC